MHFTILGLDVATSTGVCWKMPGAWRCLAVHAEGQNAEEKAADLSTWLYDELGRHPADFAAIEMPLRNVVAYGDQDESGEKKQTINPNALQLSALAGAVVAVLEMRRVGWGLIAPATWRAGFFGRKWKPQDGNWKAAAVSMCGTMKVPLPETARARNDAAEAVGIATSWAGCTFIPERHQRAFMALRTGRAA